MSGLIYVFAYHVPLFFFLSGCMDTLDKEQNYFKYVWKKLKAIIIPYYGFAFLIILLQTLAVNADFHTILHWVKIVLLGCMRNEFFAGSIWFLTCLFIVQIIFKIFKYCNSKVLIIIFSIICIIIYCIFFPFKMHELPYNIDAALWYIGFYALGYIFFPYIKDLFSSKKLSTKIIFTFFIISGIVISILVYLRVIPMEYLKTVEASSNSVWKESLRYLVLIVVPLVLIMFNLCISKLLCEFSMLSKMGRQTLYLCLNEYIIRNIVIFTVCLIGLDIHTNNAVMVIIYATFLVLIGCYIIIPFEKKVIERIKTNIKDFYTE